MRNNHDNLSLGLVRATVTSRNALVKVAFMARAANYGKHLWNNSPTLNALVRQPYNFGEAGVKRVFSTAPGYTSLANGIKNNPRIATTAALAGAPGLFLGGSALGANYAKGVAEERAADSIHAFEQLPFWQRAYAGINNGAKDSYLPPEIMAHLQARRQMAASGRPQV